MFIYRLLFELSCKNTEKCKHRLLRVLYSCVLQKRNYNDLGQASCHNRAPSQSRHEWVLANESFYSAAPGMIGVAATLVCILSLLRQYLTSLKFVILITLPCHMVLLQ